MKIISLILLSVLSCFLQENRIKGVYRIEFDKKYQTQTFQVTFNDSLYVKKMPDALTSKGKIKYEKFKAVLKQNNDDDPIEIDLREVGKDTIKFSTRSKSDQSKVMNRGMLIKIK